MSLKNGVDLEHFRPRPPDHSLAASLGIDPDSLCIGSCAGTGAYKRIDLMIEAARRLQPGRPVTIIVLGNAVSGKAYEERAQRAGLDRFIYAGFHQDVRPYVSLFHVGFILSDRIETISYAAREMMAMGRPLISSSFSGLKDNVRDGVDGWLVRPGNVKDIVHVLERLRKMPPQELHGFGLRARQAAEERFDMRQQLRKHADLYTSLVEGTSQRDVDWGDSRTTSPVAAKLF
ncbi:MAG: glycosyltransferase family 4 protein [Methylacidiphilales bacterium]|nr:glycosyltransferase family 4 protein [Candidatus Methylacidiphilales bacterium]MDW8350225.1 glycosyltransferase family 4 protein [Verrucomicrobiae bacterium]